MSQNSSIFRVFDYSIGTSSSTLVTVSNDRTFKIWSIDRLECLFESPQLGQFSLTCSAIVESGGSPPKVVAKSIRKDKKDEEKNKTSQVLALGNCDGKILLYDIDSQFEGNRANSAYFKFDNITII